MTEDAQNIPHKKWDVRDVEQRLGGLHHPFKRLAILERFAQQGEAEFLANFLAAPLLDSLQIEMVDTGKARSELSVDRSKSSTTASSSFNLLDGRSNSASSKSSSQSSEKRSRKWGWKKKAESEPPAGWDVFPGIMAMRDVQAVRETSSEAPSSSFSQTESGTSHNVSTEPVSAHKNRKQRTSPADLLARTFDLRDHGEAELSPDRTGVLVPGVGSDATDQSTVGGKSLVSADSVREVTDTNSGGAITSLREGLSVKDTCRLHVHKFKGLTFVNEYAIITTLGKGSFGEVKLALNTIDMEVYALKLISKTRRRQTRASAKEHVAEAAVLREINVMKELSHPNLVRLIEVIDDPTNHKILMVLEYVEGGSLFAGTKMAPKKRLPELTARKYFRDVLQGLSYLHANKIAHGDVKPENFLLGTDGHLKLADFGSSQLMRVGDLVNRSAGTPAFMAPEMCSGEAYSAKSADLWALGCSLFLFCFGTVPFKSNSILGLYNEICNTPLSFPSEVFVSDSLKHLLSGLLEKDAEQRMKLISVMSHPWVTYNGEMPLLPPSLEEQLTNDFSPKAYLMESWGDDPEDRLLLSALSTMAQAPPKLHFPDGTFLVRYGEPFQDLYKIQEGEVEVSTFEDISAESDEDADDELQAPHTSPTAAIRRSRLLPMLEAATKACEHTCSRREVRNGQIRIISRRGKGNFIGEPGEFGGGPKAGLGWQIIVQAKGDVVAKLIPFDKFYELSAKFPEFEADGRTVMAQRRGKFLTQSILERLGSLKHELEAELADLQGGNEQ